MILFCLVFLAGNLYFSQGVSIAKTKVGSKDFKLGQSRSTVKAIIKRKYMGKKLSTFGNGNITIHPKSSVEADLFFDHKGRLYFMRVTIDSESSGGEKLKKILQNRYNNLNIIQNEQYRSSSKVYVLGRWLIEKGRYQVTLLESMYCRGNSRLIPCVLKVEYLDKRLQREFRAHLKKVELDKKNKRTKDKYDSF